MHIINVDTPTLLFIVFSFEGKYSLSELTLKWAAPPQKAMSYGSEVDHAVPQYKVFINTTKSWLRRTDIRKDHVCGESYDCEFYMPVDSMLLVDVGWGVKSKGSMFTTGFPLM